SGTIPIEAALIAKNRAPGLNRDFSAMAWPGFARPVWDAAREEAQSREFHGDYRIFASDLDGSAVALARENARRAGVEDVVRFEVADAAAFARQTERGILVCNPPYGERLGDRAAAEAVYAAFGKACRALSHWKLGILSAHPDFERAFGREAEKKRKLYNGMLKCEYYIYPAN
nr:methyltransferase [Oscillospiraceae bacterium]